MKITREKLNQIYHEILMREPDELSEPYLNHDEDFIRESIGKSPERWKLIRGVNFLKRFGLIKLFEKGNNFGNWLSGLK